MSIRNPRKKRIALAAALGLLATIALTVAVSVNRECEECRQEEDLRALVHAQIPELRSTLRSNPLASARLLLHWAANAADQALTQNIVMAGHAQISSGSAAKVYYDQFLANRGAAYCGGIAVFFDRVLKLFGYPSFTIDFGDLTDGMTHVSVVVPVNEQGVWRYYLFDPTFNMTFRHPENEEHIPILQMLDLVQVGQRDQIAIETQSLRERDFVTHESDCPVEFSYKAKGDNHNLICSHPDYGIEMYLRSFRHALEAGGYTVGPTGLIELLAAHVFSVGPSTQPGVRARFIESLRERGLPGLDQTT